MADIVAITRERHTTRTWQRPTSYTFAAKDPVVALVSQEVPRAMVAMALGFIERDGATSLVAIQGLKPGQNKFVSPEGRWLGDYIPAVYRVQPFKLARDQKSAEILCIDELAGGVSESRHGEPFFLPDGKPSPAISESLKMLGEIESDKCRTQRACDSIAQYKLLEPWPLKMQEGEQIIEANGIMRISEAGLYALEPSALAELRDVGGLMLAFAQLFSMQQIHRLAKLSATATASPTQTISNKLTDTHGIISFANL